MQPIVIRRAAACASDAERLKTLEAHTLGDSDLSAQEMLAVLARPEQYVYLAEAGDQGVGFCAAFETASPRGPRLELDMLGVSQGWRGRGIGQALVHRAIAEATVRGTYFFRAVVAMDNTASSRVFVRCGLAAEPERREMLVYAIRGTVPQPFLPNGWREEHVSAPEGTAGWPPELLACGCLPGHTLVLLYDASGRPIAGAALLLVHTIAYSGIWIEAQWARGLRATHALARAAVERAKAQNLDEVGLLHKLSANRGELGAYVEEGYQRAGTYRVFTRHTAG